MSILPSMIVLALAAPQQQQGVWPGFLGEGASQLQMESLPLSWSPSEGIAWQRQLPGYGQSSPVVWDGTVFVTSVSGADKNTLHVVAFDLESGDLSWESETASTFPEKASVYISRAAPTPVVDADGIYAYFESGDVVALTRSGEERWKRSLSDDYGRPKNKFGLSSSPVQTDDQVIILIDDEEAAYLISLSKETGETLWKTDRKPRTNWSSPAIVEIGGEPQVVCSSDGTVIGYDTKTGKELWTFDQVGGNRATTPQSPGEGQFFIGASAGRQGENATMARKSNGLLVVEKQGSDYVPKFQWTTPKATPSWASPVAHDGVAYWVNRSAVVFCVDVETGVDVFTERISESCWATPIGVGERVYFFGKSGTTSVLRSGREFEVLAENKLWTEENPPVNNVPVAEEETEERRSAQAMFSAPTLYGVAVANDSFILRTGSQLFCVRKP
ncbi:outer membrane protein assembly factor BamB family protein [Thalassoglobus neptunius]|nr:PQQ-binding-like beta-propeller repeat protein [Thalassoglobus neptunius]